MITTEDLKFIATIAAHRTLAEAARALNITPPSVTLRLQHIEKKLSVKIIQ
ncbi:helix-turn-helix domain-containing protein [Vibrio aestuarianus]|uniref:LysR family transcriptional regulator n=1 Tax=Vibrio aestuarianus TaxID=28171 RepID=A0A9X4IUY9_9VIBR|nr:LysR family transcriptional regulator [Vibrio aestuarianus]MDE1244094.1 LysR family transcriptional regulator [Vibrio aestuarianus]